MRNENNMVLSLQNLKIDKTWANIIYQILSNELEFKYMVKKLILTNNYMRS